jgi:cellulose 1,4-beta-cellobiosidase
MIRAQSSLVSAVVLLTACTSASATGLAGTSAASASTTSLCRFASARVSSGAYIVQNNEYASSADECIRLGSGPAFTVTSSGIANATNGTPGAYPSSYFGCHWGTCTTGSIALDPVPVSGLRSGLVVSNWSTAQPATKTDVYDVAYDIWINRTPRTNTAPDGSEVMIWLGRRGPVVPMGRQVATGVRIGNRTYNVWYSPPATPASGDTISYVMTSPTKSVYGLDIGDVIRNSVSRGYTQTSWYLIDVEAGFELWHGGVGLATRSFAVRG